MTYKELTGVYEQIYLNADKLAKTNKQTVGEKNEFYITLNQLMNLLPNEGQYINRANEERRRLDK